jgi:transcriptional regulator with XRE-family HTH domain
MSEVSVTTQVADRIKRLRHDKRWSARQLADECSRAGMGSLTRSTIAKIESGVRKSITVDELAVLSRVLGVPPGFLIGDVETSAPEQHRRTHSVPEPEHRVFGVLSHRMADYQRRAVSSSDKRVPWSPAGRCTLIAADIVGSGQRDINVQLQTYLRDRLYELFAQALANSGIELDRCYFEDRGDGLVIAIPPEFPTERLIHPFVEYLRAGLRMHNMVSSELAQMRLRIALHSDQAWTDIHGLVGDSVIQLFRLLDAPTFKQAIHKSGAYLAVIASATTYEVVIRNAIGLIDPDEYTIIELSDKQQEFHGWVRLIGRPSSIAQLA